MKKIFTILFTLSLLTSIYPQNLKTQQYLKSISGKLTIAGEHNREPNTAPTRWTDSIYATTGKYPGLWSGDFLFQANNISNRWSMIYEAERQWNKGAIINIMFHTCPPTQDEPCGWSPGVTNQPLTDSQWNDLITDGTQINSNWKHRLDIISTYLQYLKEKGVEVMFRPLHEMNQGAFWWGGRPGSKGTAKLYRITHDYLTLTKGLDNLLWIWDMQDLSMDWGQYNPGDEYWDILGFDVYGSGYGQNWYNYALSVAGDKPLAIGECSVFPTESQLLTQSRYVFFMGWSELVFSNNTTAKLQSLFNASKVITLDEMPGWKSYCPYSGIPFSIPGIIQAEDFNDCGEGISYHDSDTSNTGNAYRWNVGVDIETCSEGGFNINDIQKGEWLAYSINVDSSGTYCLEAHIASESSDKTFHIEIDDVNISGDIIVPNAGDMQSWQSVIVATPPLTPGLKNLRLVFDSDSINIDYLTVKMINKAPIVKITSPNLSDSYTTPADVTIIADAVDEDGKINKVEFYSDTLKLGETTSAPYTYQWHDVSAGTYVLIAKATDNGGLTTVSEKVNLMVKSKQTPYNGDPFLVPGLIEAEDYDNGGEGLSYHELTAGNKFGFYRQDDVDVEQCSDTSGGYSLGDFQTGEWIEYSINVAEADTFDMELRVATESNSAKLSVVIGSRNVTGTLEIPNTGGWQNWQSVHVTDIQLPQGENTIRVNSITEFTNINFLKFTKYILSGLSAHNVIPKEFMVYQNYPNPFNPTTTINYSIADKGNVKVKIFDMLGREVQILLDEEQNPGYYSLEFNGEDLSSGIYFYMVSSTDKIQTKQMLLLK